MGVEIIAVLPAPAWHQRARLGADSMGPGVTPRESEGSLAVFGSNLLGDALRDTLDPRLRGA